MDPREQHAKPNMTQRLAVALALLVVTGCAGRVPGRPAAHPAASMSGLELLGEFNIPPLSAFDHLGPSRFGGISGLAFDPRSGELLGVCDDRDMPRVFVFRLRPFERGVPWTLDLHSYFPLPNHRDGPEALDAEGIVMTRSGRILIASEGIQNEEPRIPPAIVEYSRRVEFVRQLAIPSKFVPPATGPITRGVRNNASFESLTLSPDETRLFTASESPLAQDGPAAGVTEGGLVRILEYTPDGDTWTPGREFAYPIDPLGPIDFSPRFVVTGLVELLAVSRTELLAMERGFAEEDTEGERRGINRIRIFRVRLDGATDISAFDSLRGRQVRPARKTLLLDLADVEGLSPELANLDNFEGMAFGPAAPGGERTLILVSDDNFNPRQRTSFLLFRILP